LRQRKGLREEGIRFSRKACCVKGQKKLAEDERKKEQHKELPMKQLKERTELNEK